jgi:pimeloyl-ACP methyl ester carboxylesterase
VAAALPDARVQIVAGAGHWPWSDRDDVVTGVCDFLET